MNIKNVVKSVSWASYRWIRSRDTFNQSINLTFKGSDSYKTFFGGCWSLTTMILMVVYAINLFLNITSHKNATNTVSSIHKDMITDNAMYKPYEEGFMLAIALIDSNYHPIELDEEIVSLNIYQTIVSTANGTINMSNTDLGYHNWANEFIGIDNFVQDGKVYSKILWANNTDFNLQGSFLSEAVQAVSIDISECTQNCKTQDQIDAYFQDLYVTLIIIEYYVDFNDFENPIKYYVNNENGYLLKRDKIIYGNLFIQQNEANFQDSWIHFNDNENHKFWSFSKITSNVLDKYDQRYFSYTLFADSKFSNYQRVSYSLMDVIANTGGVYGIIQLFSILIIGYFGNNSLLFEIIQKLFYFKKEDNLECKQYDNFTNSNKISSKSVKLIDVFGVSKSKIGAKVNYNFKNKIEEIKEDAQSDI